MRKEIDREALFQPIKGAAAISGLSVKYIRDGCKNGTIPHIRAGADYRIDMTAWLDKLHAISEGRE